jgi:hypothetical protein
MVEIPYKQKINPKMQKRIFFKDLSYCDLKIDTIIQDEKNAMNHGLDQ